MRFSLHLQLLATLVAGLLARSVLAQSSLEVDICINKRRTRSVTKKKAKRLITLGRAKRGSCESRFATICRNGKRTLIVSRKALQVKLDRGDTLGRCVCAKDTKVCKIGGLLRRRDWRNKCRFEACPCTRDLKLCPDGVTEVGRDGFNNCEFEPCPTERRMLRAMVQEVQSSEES